MQRSLSPAEPKLIFGGNRPKVVLNQRAGIRIVFHVVACNGKNTKPFIQDKKGQKMYSSVWAIVVILGISCSTGALVPAQVKAACDPTVNRLQVERAFDAPRQKVFRAWTDPQAIKKWFVYQNPVHWTSDPVANANPGGEYRLSVVRDDDETEAYKFHGIYHEVKPPEKLVFTWDWEALRDVGPGHTTVTLEFLNQSARQSWF
jgi:uncharacterized protein YndB with AHSA1/START domain